MNKAGLLLYLPALLFTLFFSAFTASYSFHAAYNDTLPQFRAKEHKGKSISTTKGLVTFTTGLHNDTYLVDSGKKTAWLYLEIKTEKLVNPSVRRAPLNIAIVIDRSGSMQGVKMGHAKRAAKSMIDMLMPQDMVSIVMYDNTVDSVQSPVRVTNKEAIKKKIDGIVPRGATNLWGGTDMGYAFVKRNYDSSAINRVLLISDGLANAGLTDSSRIHIAVQQYKDNQGISLSTFGVGLDYNEKLMTDMAETGAGNYYFIDAPEKTSSIMSKELDGLLNAAVQSAGIRMELPPGVGVIKGYPYHYRQKDAEVFVSFRELFSNETRGMLFQLELPRSVNTALKFEATLSYTDAVEGLPQKLVHTNTLAPAKNAAAYAQQFNKPVIQQTVLLAANENMEKLMSKVDEGNYAAAMKMLESNQAYLKNQDSYVSGMPSLKSQDSLQSVYASQLPHFMNLPPDTVRIRQKKIREVNYRIRNKKQ